MNVVMRRTILIVFVYSSKTYDWSKSKTTLFIKTINKNVMLKKFQRHESVLHSLGSLKPINGSLFRNYV